MLTDPRSPTYFDISGMKSPNTWSPRPSPLPQRADLINRYPDRFLFGTDEVAPSDQAKYFAGLRHVDAPLFAKLTPEASQKLRKGNYERLFDEARRQRPGLGSGEREMKPVTCPFSRKRGG